MKRMMILGFLFVFLGAGNLSASGSSSGGSSGGGNGSKTQVDVTPTTAQEWYDAGFKLSDKGQFKEALLNFKKAISLKGDYAEAYNMLGYCTRKLGNATDAFAYYDKALKLKPNFPEAREYYGEAYLQSGDLAKAVQQYVILQKAGNKNAAELLEKIGDYVNNK